MLGIETLLNEAAETVGNSDDLVDGVAHFRKKNKSNEEKAKIDSESEDLKAAGKIVKGSLGWATLASGVAVALEFLGKK